MILELEAEVRCCTEGILPAFKTATFSMCLHMAEKPTNPPECLLTKTQVPSPKLHPHSLISFYLFSVMAHRPCQLPGLGVT